jgi:hypothetical protein
MALVQDQASPEAQVRQQLLQLAGAPAAAQPASGGTDRPLKDATLLALYQRFPHYVRGPFRARLAPSVRQPRTALLKRAIDQRDDELIDLLASHFAAYQPRSGDTALIDTARLTADYYAPAPSPEHARCASQRASRHVRSMRHLERANPRERAVRGARVGRAATRDVAELLAAPDRQVRRWGSMPSAGRARRWVDANLIAASCWRAVNWLPPGGTEGPAGQAGVGAGRGYMREANLAAATPRGTGRAGRQPAAALPAAHRGEQPVVYAGGCMSASPTWQCSRETG